MTNLAQNKRIHGLRKQLSMQGFLDDDYRALLIAKFPLAFKGIPSSKDLSLEQAGELIDALRELAGEPREFSARTIGNRQRALRRRAAGLVDLGL